MDIQELLASPAGLAIKGALVAAFLDFAFGVFAAFKDGTFAIDAIAAFLRKHLIGRVLPVSILATVGYLTSDQVMLAAAAASLTAYTAETMGSIYGSIRPPAASDAVGVSQRAAREDHAHTPVNPIPQD